MRVHCQSILNILSLILILHLSSFSRLNSRVILLSSSRINDGTGKRLNSFLTVQERRKKTLCLQFKNSASERRRKWKRSNCPWPGLQSRKFIQWKRSSWTGRKSGRLQPKDEFSVTFLNNKNKEKDWSKTRWMRQNYWPSQPAFFHSLGKASRRTWTGITWATERTRQGR